MASEVESEKSGAAPLHQVEDIFHQVLRAPEEQRSQLLENLCHGDVALSAELQSLLDASQAEELLGQERAAAAHSSDSTTRGRSIGRYRLERLLGRGGMGAVYLAHRADGQFEQQVAVKLIDLPLATDLFRERFRLERQILARLAHPFIARLLDGGISEAGELYLVMEYVEGVSITRYCEQNGLSLRERLALFSKICGAVQFAHQNLVVHRDIKPDNILVAADGTPRLLDFGTAKLLGPLPDAAVGGFTQQGIQSFTPQYASPEQVLGEPITTASDTYSLGVLLYELLAGVPPYTMQEFTTAELLRVICSQQPAKPSSAPVPPDHHPLQIDADLDAIVLKALRKEPQQRYVTIEQLDGDIQAWLGGRPVMARRGTWRYRAGKFSRRNKLPLFVAGLLVLSLAGGIVGVLWQSSVANRQRQRAEARSEDLRQLSKSLLSEIDEAIKELPGSTPVQRMLVARVLDHLDRMSRDVADDRVTQLDLVDAYTRLGNLQGNPYDQNIGDSAGALRSLDRAAAMAQSLLSADHADSSVLAALALAQQSRSEVLFGAGRTRESVDAMRLALEAFSARIAKPGATAGQIADAATAAGGLGDQLGEDRVASLADPVGALNAYRLSLALSERALTIEPGFARSQRGIAIDHFKIGDIVAATDFPEAIHEYRLSLAAWEALPSAEQSGTTARRGIAATYRKLGLALTEARDYQQAILAFEKARHTYESYAAADTADTRAQYDLSVFLSDESQVYVAMLDPALNPRRADQRQITGRALELLRRAIAIEEPLVALNAGNQSWRANLAYEKCVAGTLEQSLGMAGEGLALATSGIATITASALAQDASVDVLDMATSAMLMVIPVRLRDGALALRSAQRLVALTHRRKPAYLLSLARAYRMNGQVDKAAATATEGLAQLPQPAAGAQATRLYQMLSLETKRVALKPE